MRRLPGMCTGLTNPENNLLHMTEALDELQGIACELAGVADEKTPFGP
jgi:hypothetical protein